MWGLSGCGEHEILSVAVLGLLIVVASLLGQALGSRSSVVEARRL